MKIKDLAGRKFGMLTVIKQVDDDISLDRKYRVPRWLCECECGKRRIVTSHNLQTGRITACGCRRPKRAREISHNKQDNSCVATLYLGRFNSPEKAAKVIEQARMILFDKGDDISETLG
jgi:hypothetical protein